MAEGTGVEADLTPGPFPERKGSETLGHVPVNGFASFQLREILE